MIATLSPDHRALLRETFVKGPSVARTYYAVRALKLRFEQRGIEP